MIRPSRQRSGIDPALNLKMGIFVLGAILAFVGMGMGARWLVGVAIGVLVLGLAMRIIPRFKPPEPPEEGDSEG